MMKSVTDYNTLIIIGPKGCGKTSALKLLASHLHEKGEKVYYIDLGMGEVPVNILQSKDLSLSTLLIDNVQLIDKFEMFRFRFDELIHPNIVAACSPGYNDQKLKQFRKHRGDGKVLDVYFQPLSSKDSKALLTWVFSRTKDGDPGYQKPVVDFSKLSEGDFQALIHETGGVPQYLIHYCQFGNHDLMKSELSRQFHDAIGESTSRFKYSPVEFCRQLIKIMTTTSSPPNQLVELGIAYVDHQNKVCLTSRIYIKWALKYSGLIVETEHDSQVLENLTILNIMCRECVIKNYTKSQMEVPIATKLLVQDTIGEFPQDFEEGSVSLVKLAPSHPVIDLLLIDKRSREAKVYFIQVSSQKYDAHDKKQVDLGKTKLTENNPTTVRGHYQKRLRYTNEYFVYATPESECMITRDDKVYYLDLKHQVF